ncbi:MAG: S1 RNA-binding domain-containing protein [Elusimicrobiota bacterium]|nr:S1 RNA-binding domain-containing protein [Endomicrobiia bacterium]MDW8165523.1 S1 RNA-binding domain-containing protein [Elusimicrobiota bacterium]
MKDNNDEVYIDEPVVSEEIYDFGRKIEVGDIVEGKIISITKEGVYVDIGSKTDGFIPISEFGRYIKEIDKHFKNHQMIKVFVVKLDYNNTHLLSFKKAKEIEIFDLLNQKYKEQIPIDTYIISKNKNGYLVDIGIEAFMPNKEVGETLKKKISSEKIEDISFKVIIKEISGLPAKNLKIIVSNKIYEEKLKEEQRKKTLSQLKEGDEVIGEVKSITSFGAFIDINGVEALLHISNIAWYKLNHPEEILHCGDKIKVKILKIENETGKVSVGLKQLFPYPWDEVDSKYFVGKIVKCKVTNITNFGIFAELEPGVEGLIHISEVSWTDKTPDLKKMFKIGQELQAKILEINKEEEKISLSLKKVFHNPWEDIKTQFPPGSINKGKIIKITPTSILVSIKDEFYGVIHISDVSWTSKVTDLHRLYKVGQYIEYKVLEIIPEQEKAVLSIKHLKENPYEKYSVDSIVKCKIKKVLSNLIIVELEEGIEGIITKKEALLHQRDLSKELKVFYKPGQEVEAVVIFSDEKKRKIELSIRKLEKIIQKQLIKQYSQIQLPTLRDILTEE